MFGTGSENVRNCWVPLPLGGSPSPPSQIFGNVRKMFGQCSEKVWKMFGAGVADPPTLPREAVPPENVRQMFGIGGCLPHIGGSSPRKSSEMFGKCSEHVRNRRGRSTNPPPGPATPVPNILRTFSDHFSRNHHPEEGGNPLFPSMFRTCSKHVRVAPPPGEGWGSGHASS